MSMWDATVPHQVELKLKSQPYASLLHVSIYFLSTLYN